MGSRNEAKVIFRTMSPRLVVLRHLVEKLLIDYNYCSEAKFISPISNGRARQTLCGRYFVDTFRSRMVR